MLTQWSIGRGMVEYANQKEVETLMPFRTELAQIYQRQGNWDVFIEQPHLFKQLLDRHLDENQLLPKRNEPPHKRKPREPRPSKAHHNPPPHPDDRPPKGEHHNRPPPKGKDRHMMSYVLMDEDKNYLVGRYDPDREYAYGTILADEKVIGYLAVSKRHHLTQGYELAFIEQQRTYLYLFAFGMMALVAIFTLPLARHLVEPLKQLASNIHALTQGNYAHRHTAFRKDEFGQLQQDQNKLAQTLEQNDKARSRWLANTSHELRTPVAVLRGEIEAMLDGIHDRSEANVESLLQEVLQLQTLIDDLQQLNRAELGGMTFNKANLDLTQFLTEKAESMFGFMLANKVELKTDFLDTPCLISGDPVRLGQLIENLCQNSVKYAGQNSTVSLSLVHDDYKAVIRVEDNGPGVENSKLPYLFEYLYRVEDSRSRHLGGSGLGLAICKHIVEGHEGTIHAEHSRLGGLAIVISLKMQNHEPSSENKQDIQKGKPNV